MRTVARNGSRSWRSERPTSVAMDFTAQQQTIVDRIRNETESEIQRIEPATVGVLVVRQPPDAAVPKLFHVTLEPSVDGSDSLHWEFVGSVDGTTLNG